jgi:DNA-binding response OmpR family regulator
MPKTKSRAQKRPQAVDRARILMVEDDEDFQTILRGWLAPHYDTESLADGEWLLDEAAIFRPDLFILDVTLPGANGFNLCRRLRADSRFACTPILFLTGLVEIDAFLRHLEIGGSAFVTKPIGRLALLEKVKELLEP